MALLFAALGVVAAIIVGFVGISSLSEATLGVGLIGFACLLGILSRIMQAEGHQKQTAKMLATLTTQLKDQTTLIVDANRQQHREMLSFWERLTRPKQ